MKKGYKFYSEDPRVFSIFNGYDYDIVDDVNDSRVQMWLNHIKEVLANNDEIVCDYIIKWYAYILQNIEKKAKVVLLLTGIEGCGKSIVSLLFSKLFGVFGEDNITNIDDVCGKFNSVVENKKFIVCNELSSVENNKAFNPESMKGLITEYSVRINKKNEHKRTSENVASFMMISNDSVPVKISRDDRRYMICECSSKYANNLNYFAPFYESLEDKQFLNQIFTFFMKLDIGGYSPSNIPKTKAKEEMLDILKSPYEQYVESTVEGFDEKGENVEDYYKGYRQFAVSHGFAVASINTFGKETRRFIIKKRVRINGGLENRYFLNEEYKQKVLSNDGVDIDFDLIDDVHV